jgi:RNA polymerase sigma factor (sigma-70 family)
LQIQLTLIVIKQKAYRKTLLNVKIKREVMENLINKTDEELAYMYIDGNNRAFDELLKRNQSKLFSYIQFVVRDNDIADDLFQDTFVKIIMKLQSGKYTDSGKFSSWVLRIAHNIIMDYYRQQKSIKVTNQDDNDMSKLSSDELMESFIENDIINNQTLSDVRTMMNMLPPPQREVVYMRFYQNLSFKEIADLTNVSINTSLGRMRYAILNMRRMARENNVTLSIL